MSNVGFRIQSRINCPDKNLVEAFRGIPVANISDNMNRTCCLHARIRPMNSVPLLGPAFTVKTRPGDNLLLHKAVDMAMPGDVIVVDGQGNLEYALIGELMFLWARERGIAGIVVDGAVRDADALRAMDIAAYAAGITPAGPSKEGPGEINFPISCGGVLINPGDIMIGDCDGIVAIHSEDAPEVLKKAQATVKKEADIIRDIKNREWDRSWVDKVLRDKNCEFIG